MGCTRPENDDVNPALSCELALLAWLAKMTSGGFVPVSTTWQEILWFVRSADEFFSTRQADRSKGRQRQQKDGR